MHPGFAMEEAALRLLPERTGKSLDEWVEIVRRDGPATEREQREWLKSAHGFTTNYALWVAGVATGGRTADAYDPDANVEKMYAGKEGLLPVHDRLLRLALALGNDVVACPGTTIVPLYRKHVFAQIRPTTKTRIDLGLALKGVATPARLIDTGGAAKGDRITHRIPLTSLAEIDDEVEQWLKTAYDRDA